MMLSLVWPIASLGFLLSMTQEAMTAANRVAEIFDAPLEITDGPRTRGAAAAAASNSSTSDSGFPTPTTWALRHVNLDRRTRGDAGAGRRDRIGQVGAHRAVVAALRRHRGRHPDRRRRHPRSAPVRAAPGRGHRLRGSDAVLDVGAPRTSGWAGPTPPTSELAAAIDIAAAGFVYDLPFGLDTRIGEQGMSLSGGQRQRLSLARAIVAAPADPGARRHVVGAGCAHRGRRDRGAAPGAARR